MCTVLLRIDPSGAWPLLLLAVRDEYLGRPWDGPGHHWPNGPDQPDGSRLDGDLPDGGRQDRGRVVGGRDRVSGGTWLAVDPQGPAVAAVLNGERLPMPAGVARPSRGCLPLAVLDGAFDPAGVLPDAPGRPGFDGFHLLYATTSGARLWSWDGVRLRDRELAAGDHVIVNLGPDAVGDPLVPHLAPRLRATPSPDPRPDLGTREAWAGWLALLEDPLPPTDPRALLIRHQVGDRQYGSGSVSLVALAPDGLRYDFCGDPLPPGQRERLWTTVSVRRPEN